MGKHFTMKLFDALCVYDGKAVTILSEAQAKYGKEPAFISEVIKLASSPKTNVSEGATWLIKSNIESGTRLSARQTRNLFKGVEHITSWQAQLHVCQIFDYLDVPKDQATTVADWLTPLLQHQRPFLRAWSMNAFQHLAAQHKTFRVQADAALIDAENDKAASVRARARNIRKKS